MGDAAGKRQNKYNVLPCLPAIPLGLDLMICCRANKIPKCAVIHVNQHTPLACGAPTEHMLTLNKAVPVIIANLETLKHINKPTCMTMENLLHQLMDK